MVQIGPETTVAKKDSAKNATTKKEQEEAETVVKVISMRRRMPGRRPTLRKLPPLARRWISYVMTSPISPWRRVPPSLEIFTSKSL